jgi:hypothetical protein
MLIHEQNSYALAASGAPVAVKRRTVEPVNKEKIIPVLLTVEDRLVKSPKPLNSGQAGYYALRCILIP